MIFSKRPLSFCWTTNKYRLFNFKNCGYSSWRDEIFSLCFSKNKRTNFDLTR